MTHLELVPDQAGRILPGDPDGGWWDLAACAQTDPEAFYPDKGGSSRPAKQVCRGCPVRAECLEYALEHGERYGIWGGLSERERRRIEQGMSRRVSTAFQLGRELGRRSR